MNISLYLTKKYDKRIMAMIFLLFLCVKSFELEIANNQIFCFGEELSEQTLMVGTISNALNQGTINVSVRNALSESLFSKNNTNLAKFSFTALDSGTHSICIENAEDNIASISVDIKTGVRAKDYSNIVSLKDVKEIDYRIKMYEDLIKQIHNRMQVLREREEQMRNTNLTIHSRVITYSVCTVILLMILAVIQILYLKKFFRAKKMI